MRIIAGKYKRQTLKTPPGTDTTRPTADRTKESIFNILAQRIENANVLDLFSGSGALGLEALSRYASKVTFVENNKQALACIKENLAKLKIPSTQFLIIEDNVTNFLSTYFSNHNNKSQTNPFFYDVIFADPPWISPWYDQALELLENSKLCAPNCLLMLEMDAGRKSIQGLKSTDTEDIEWKSSTATWTLIDERKYGAARLEFWLRQLP